MADTKISALTAVVTPAGTDEFAVNQSSTSKKETLAQIQTFVNNAPVFAAGSATASTKPKLTSGTVLTTAEAGALEYDGASFYETMDTTSGRAATWNEQIYRITANGSTIGPSIADLWPATSSYPMAASGVYEIEYLMALNKVTAGTVTYTVANTGTITNMIAHWEMLSVTGISSTGAVSAAGIVTSTSTAASLNASGSVTASANFFSRVRLVIEQNAAGNVRLRVTSSAGTVQLLRGSFYRARRLPAGNVGTFVA